MLSVTTLFEPSFTRNIDKQTEISLEKLSSVLEDTEISLGIHSKACGISGCVIFARSPLLSVRARVSINADVYPYKHVTV
jgi:hypothetical protein